MNFADDFSKTFCDKEEFLEFLDGIECGAEWQKHPTNTVLVIAGRGRTRDLREDKGHGRERGNHKRYNEEFRPVLMPWQYLLSGRTDHHEVNREQGQNCRFCSIGFAEGEISPGIK